MKRPQTNPELIPFWETVFLGGVDTAVLYGGRSSSKTRDTACQLVRLVDHVARNHGIRMRVLCVRRFQNRIQESVYTELKWAAGHLGLADNYDVQKTTIIHNLAESEFIFYGIERNLEEIKGTSDVDILWIEEAEKLTEDQWKVISPTIRKEDSLTILLFNPRYVTDYVWKEFVMNTPENCHVHQINYDRNQFLSEKAKRDIELMRNRDPDKYRNVYLGEPMGESERSIFRRKWLDACVDAHRVLEVALTGRAVIGFDPADDGEDKCATVGKAAGVVVDAEDWSSDKDQLVANAKRVWAAAHRRGAIISYDTIGVGAFVGGYVDEQNDRHSTRVPHYAFHAGGAVFDPTRPSDSTNPNSPTNQEEYLNLKAQGWANTARKAMLTFNAVVRGHTIRPEDVLSFDSAIGEKKLDALFTELCVPWWVETEGKKRVSPKVKLKKELGVKSHNLADALIAADNIDMGEQVGVLLPKRYRKRRRAAA